jgi:hypothetical protein
MDRRSIEISYEHSKIVDAHWDGGYLSRDSMKYLVYIQQFPELEQQDIYKNLFNAAWALVEKIKQNARYDETEDGVDLSQEGLGFYEVVGKYKTEEDGTPTDIRYIIASPYAFNPIPESDLVFDYLSGLFVQQNENEHPDGWRQPVFSEPGHLTEEEDEEPVSV